MSCAPATEPTDNNSAAPMIKSRFMWLPLVLDQVIVTSLECRGGGHQHEGVEDSALVRNGRSHRTTTARLAPQARGRNLGYSVDFDDQYAHTGDVTGRRT